MEAIWDSKVFAAAALSEVGPRDAAVESVVLNLALYPVFFFCQGTLQAF